MPTYVTHLAAQRGWVEFIPRVERLATIPTPRLPSRRGDSLVSPATSPRSTRPPRHRPGVNCAGWWSASRFRTRRTASPSPALPRNDATVTRPPAVDDERLITLVGTLPDLQPGEAIVAHGWWRNDPKHGWQFQAAEYRTTLPATVQGMKRYLGSGLVKGIGPVNAGRIVDAFGETTFAVIDETPDRLTEVPGIGPVRAGRIAPTWEEQRHIREVMAALQSYGLSTSLAVRIYKRFGNDSTRVITAEPYRLAREVWGIGFKTADTIARAVGIAADAPERLQAGTLHALGQAADDGHTLLPRNVLVTDAAELLGADAAPVARRGGGAPRNR